MQDLVKPLRGARLSRKFPLLFWHSTLKRSNNQTKLGVIKSGGIIVIARSGSDEAISEIASGLRPSQ